MKDHFRHTPSVRYLFALFYCVALLVSMRLIFAVIVQNQLPSLENADLWQALYVGSKFDARIAALFSLPIGIICSFPFLGRRMGRGSIFCLYLLPFLLLFAIYATDLGFYFYLGVRLNSTLWELLEETYVAAGMIWQSYPVVPISLGVIATAIATTWGFAHIFATPCVYKGSRWAKGRNWFGCFLVFALCVYGQISLNMFPLRWSNAYFTPHSTLVALALNPIQNLYDTSETSVTGNYQLEQVQEAYPRMATLLHVDAPNLEQLNYARTIQAKEGKQYNVVIIIMESLGYPRTSFAAGGVDTTPYLHALAKESMLFHRFFANTRTTARAVFTTITGIPDVNAKGTASRNSFVADQQIIFNEFKGYEKYYMIGGDSSWANIRAILSHNVENLHILEGSYWKSPQVDVWGVSDHDLLQEAHEVLNQQESKGKPFVAVIQTAGFHAPFTVPPTPGFEKTNLPEESLQYYAFDDQQEYNSLRYSDFALGKFFEKAKKSDYYDNTIFFIFGDHGIKSAIRNMPQGYANADLAAWHVPLVVHTSPKLGLVPVGERYDAVSQVDVFPTAANMANISYTNTTLGRDLFDTQFDATRMVYIGGQESTPVRLVKGDYCLFQNRGATPQLFHITTPDGNDIAAEHPNILNELKQVANDMEQTARYMLFHNKQMSTAKLANKP